MPVIPWRSYRAPRADDEYVVMASRLPLRQHRMVPVMMKLTRAVQAQLHEAEGLVGYGLNAKVMEKTFLTLSVWETRADLEAFAGAAPHVDIVTKLREHVEGTVFVTWESSGEDLDTSWRFAERKLAEAAPEPTGKDDG